MRGDVLAAERGRVTCVAFVQVKKTRAELRVVDERLVQTVEIAVE